MNGTEKQAKWANEIKAKMMMDEIGLACALEHLKGEQMERLMARIADGSLGDKPIATLLKKWNEIAESKTDASWWIEHRRRNDIGGVLLAKTADTIITEEMVATL